MSNALIVPDEVAPSSQMVDVEVSLLILGLQVVARAFAPSVGGDLIDWLRIATAWVTQAEEVHRTVKLDGDPRTYLIADTELVPLS